MPRATADAAETGSAASTSGHGPKLPPRKPRNAKPAASQAQNPAPSSSNGPAKAAEVRPAPKRDPQQPQPTPSPKPSSASSRDASRESDETARLRQGVHRLRVQMMRAAMRLGWQEHFVHQVMYRLQLAENLQLPKLRSAPGAQDVLKGALAEAQRLETTEGGTEPLGLHMTVLLIGFRGAGKTALVNTLLGREQPAQGQQAPTRRVEVQRGLVAGMEVVCVDTPGLETDAAATWHNMAAVRQIRAAYRRHQPDTVLFVEQLQEERDTEGQAAVLRLLTGSLGPEIWCNTVVGFTHAADATEGQASASPSSSPTSPGSTSSSPRSGAGGSGGWQALTKQREHRLQLLIREVSGDPRLVNPVVWVENRWEEAGCGCGPQGEPVVFEGHTFRLHLRLMLLSAKILAACEALFGLQGSNQGPRTEPAPLPLGYLLNQVLVPTEPVKFPNSQIVTQARRARAAIAATANSPWVHKQAAREEAELRRRLATQQRYQSVITTSSVDRVLQPPAVGKHTPLDPPRRYRHVAVLGSDKRGVICSGTAVRPQVEPAAAMDHGDPISGASLEHQRVLRPSLPVVQGTPTEGIPLAVSVRGQCGKEHALVQGRAEAAWYHELEDRHVTAVAAEVQTNGPLEDLKALCTLQLDRHLQDPMGGWALAGGLVGSELASPGHLLARSSMAGGGRLQARARTTLAGLVPAAACLTVAQLWSWGPAGEVEQGQGASAEVSCTLRRGSTPPGGGVQCSGSTSLARAGGRWTGTSQGSLHWKAAGAKWGLTGQASGGQGRLRLRAHAQRMPLLVLVGACPMAVAVVRRVLRLLRRRKGPTAAR